MSNHGHDHGNKHAVHEHEHEGKACEHGHGAATEHEHADKKPCGHEHGHADTHNHEHVDHTPIWLPLESNPDVLNPFVHRLGLPDDWGFNDVFGLDPDLLAMVPQPCVAVCLLFPSANITAPRAAELRARRTAEAAAAAPLPPGLFFVQQHDGIGNACGTIACLHAVAAGASAGAFALNDGVLRSFLDAHGGASAAERGWALATEGALRELSDATAAAGETAGAGTDDAMDSHFISFVNVGGALYELDGRMTGEDGEAFPVCHGPTSPETFLLDAARVIREDFMARDPDNLNFNITALCHLG